MVHGLVLGGLFLIAFFSGVADLWTLRAGYVTDSGIRDRITRLRWTTSLMAILAWLAVISGTYFI